jgi:hypothetical protein
LIWSAGGRVAVKAIQKARISQKSDERNLGDGRFVQKGLSQAAVSKAIGRGYQFAWELQRRLHDLCFEGVPGFLVGLGWMAH